MNTALSFQPGFDWHDFYNPNFIDHAEAAGAQTVKFYFKNQPNVGVWQYGALQGPIVQKAYWESKVSASTALLPPSTLLPQIASLTAQVAEIQSKINELNSNLMLLSNPSSSYLQTTADIKSQQADLNQTNTALAKAQSQYDSAMDAARQSLYALDNANEPTLGDWMPAGQQNGEWINKVNPAHPFNVPKFNSAAYQFFSNEEEAIAAYVAGDVDSILEQNGLSVEGASKLPNSLNPRIIPTEYSTRNVEFLVFNQSNPSLVNPAVRQALGCITNGSGFANIPSFGTFIPLYEKFWLNTEAQSVLDNPGGQSVPCQMANTKGLLQNVVTILKSAGYTWKSEPVWDETAGTAVSGQGLTSVSGQAFPYVTLLSISEDSRQAADGMDIENAANIIGIPLTVKLVSPEELRYDVFSSHQYDMALLGWQLSDYPGYLCDWFKDGNPFGYQSDRLQSACEALNSTSDLSAAQKDVYEIQSILAQDLPFIPLYSGITYDAYRNIKYPFDSVLGGFSGVYGAPSLAIPAP